MKIVTGFAIIIAAAFVLNSCSTKSGGNTSDNSSSDSISVNVIFTGTGDNSVYSYSCVKGDTVKVTCPDGEQVNYILCELGDTVDIPCGDTIHDPVLYNPETGTGDTIHSPTSSTEINANESASGDTIH